MRRSIQSADRMADRMNISDSSSCKCPSCIKRRLLHLLSRLDIASVFIYFQQIFIDQSDSFPAQFPLCITVIFIICIRFHRMTQSIHPRHSGNVRRQSQRQFGIEHRILWHKPQIIDRRLMVRRCIRDNCRYRRFRAGSCRCRNRKQHRNLLDNPKQPLQLPYLSVRSCDTRSNRFRTVKRRSSAQRKHTVTPIFQKHFHRIFHIFIGRILFYLIVDDIQKSLFFHLFKHSVKKPSPDQSRTCNDKRLF